MANWSCRNPNCKSYGAAHPNCRCAPPDQAEHLGAYADGGEVTHCHSKGIHLKDCELYASGGMVESNQEMESNPSLAIEHLIANSGLKKASEATTEQLVASHRKGRSKLAESSSDMFGSKQPKYESSEASQGQLQSHLDNLQQDPNQLMNIGNQMDPEYSGLLAAKIATHQDYLASKKPKNTNLGSLDEPLEPNMQEKSKYARTLNTATHPHEVANRVKDGTLLPSDVQDLNTLYPSMSAKLKEHTMNRIIEAKTNGKQVSYKHRQTASRLLGSSLDNTLSPTVIPAIMQANSGRQAPQQPQADHKGHPGATPGHLSAATQKTNERVDRMYESPLEERQIDRKD